MKDDHEIKELLACHRPDLHGQGDSCIRKAIEKAQEDTELWKAVQEDWEFDQEFARSLKEIPVNQSGKCVLLDGSAGASEAEPHDASPFGGAAHQSSRKLVMLLGAMAAVLMLSGVMVKYFMFPDPVNFPVSQQMSSQTFREHMAYFATQRFTLDMATEELDVAKDWLADRNDPIYKTTPETLARLKGKGCKEIDWNGRTVSLICFENKNQKLVHLFIVKKSDLTEVEQAKLVHLERYYERQTQGWSEDGYVFLLVGSKPGVSLEGLI